ncbi:MSHA biogenesis protein MshJ [Oceanisphaera sp. IT1-181]|uniref:MSHA biogenesis protein MshJ n=1 Tax=Oceanisphaera sp. IT1-181 TaxID=3081199 RepID=UPI0029CAA694|nr:MSHA biogenesis protein MshJ [Oceanisphaera sp. IT1-181]
MSKIQPLLADLNRRFLDLSQRERWLVLGATWALLAWVGLLLYEATTQARVIALEQEQNSLNDTLAQQQQMMTELNQGIAELKSKDNAPHIARLNRHLSQLNSHVDEKMQTLVEPEQMSALLLSILEQSNGLDLLELSNELPTRLNSEQDNAALYQHNLSMVLSGSYLSLLDYVKQLEQLSGRIFWRGLEFELEKYPVATIRLNFFTISQHKELLRG